jgi:outer membrane protein assembly factor BamB
MSMRSMHSSLGVRRIGLVVVSSLLLSACDLFGGDSFFGANVAPPLPGKRISILAQQRSVEPDPSTVDVKIVLPPPTPNPEWPQAGGYANHAMHHILVSDSLRRNWAVGVGVGAGDDTRITAQPVMAQGQVYIMDAESNVRAIAARTGADTWAVDLTPDEEDDDHITGGIAYDNGRIYATTGFAEIVALDARNGRLVWRRNLGIPFRAAPTIRGGRLFAISVTNKLFALNAETGVTLWSHTGIEEGTNLLGGASPAVDNGIVVAAYSSGEIAALRVSNGSELWSDTLSAPRKVNAAARLATIRGRPIIDRGLVFAVSNSGLMAAINLRTGRRVWDRSIGSIESPWIAGNFIFVLTNSAELVAMGRADGRIHWVRALPEFVDPEDRTDRIIWTGPILASDRLIVAGSNGALMSVSPYSGRRLGTEDLSDGVSVAPIIADNAVYVLSNDADLVAYR